MNAYWNLRTDTQVADQNALLVLENIKVKGFNIGDRSNGFDKNDTEAILEVSNVALMNISIEWK